MLANISFASRVQQIARLMVGGGDAAAIHTETSETKM